MAVYYSCGWYSGKTINNYPKILIGQTVTLPFFNCINQDGLTNLI